MGLQVLDDDESNGNSANVSNNSDGGGHLRKASASASASAAQQTTSRAALKQLSSLQSMDAESALEFEHAMGNAASPATPTNTNTFTRAMRRISVPMTTLGFLNQSRVASTDANDESEATGGDDTPRRKELRQNQQKKMLKRTSTVAMIKASARRMGISLAAVGVTPFGILDPKSKFMRRWDATVMCLLMYTAVMTPYDVGFRYDNNDLDTSFWMQQCVDVLFFFDIIVNFSLGYYDNLHRRWVYDRYEIAKRYLSSWFVVDFVSILPFDVISAVLMTKNNGTGNIGSMQTLRLIRLLRLGKLLRVLRAARIFRRLESSFAVDYTALELTKFACVTVSIAHWMACGWGLVAELEHSHNRDFTWVENVIANSQETDWTNIELYIAALYWSVMTITTIGYGDISPVTLAERCYVVAAMLFGGILWGYVIGAMSGVIGARDEKLNRFRRDIKALNSFMDEASFPKSLRQKLREYFRYQAQTYSVDRYRHLLNRLSPALRREVANQRDNSWIERVHFFKNCPESFRVAIALVIEQRTYPPAEVVVREGEHAECMHIIRKGVISSGRRILTTGDGFGEEMLFHRSLPADFSSWTVTYCDVYMLTRTQLTDTLMHYPTVREHFRRKANKIVFRTEVLAYAAAVRALIKWVRTNAGKSQEELKIAEMAEHEKKSAGETSTKKLASVSLGTGDTIAHSDRARFYLNKLRSLIRLDPEEYARYVKCVTTVQAHIRRWLVSRKFKTRLQTKLIDMSISGMSHDESSDGGMETRREAFRNRRTSMVTPTGMHPLPMVRPEAAEATVTMPEMPPQGEQDAGAASTVTSTQLHHTERMVAMLHKDLCLMREQMMTNRARVERRLERMEQLLLMQARGTDGYNAPISEDHDSWDSSSGGGSLQRSMTTGSANTVDRTISMRRLRRSSISYLS